MTNKNKRHKKNIIVKLIEIKKILLLYSRNYRNKTLIIKLIKIKKILLFYSRNHRNTFKEIKIHLDNHHSNLQNNLYIMIFKILLGIHH